MSLVKGTPLTTYERGQLLESDPPLVPGRPPRVAQSVPRPRGDVVLRAAGARAGAESDHGSVEPRPPTWTSKVETQRLTDPRFAGRPYQGTTAVTAVRVRRALETRRLPAGSLWVPADQPDFEVATQLLEADAPDSLLAWGLLSSVFERKEWIEGRSSRPWRRKREGLSRPRLEAAVRDPPSRPPGRAIEWSALSIASGRRPSARIRSNDCFHRALRLFRSCFR